MIRPLASTPLVLAAVLLLTACDPGASGGSATDSPTSSRTPTPTGSITATPSPTPTPSTTTAPPPPAPAPPPAKAPLSARGAYDRCVELGTVYLYDGRPVSPAPYSRANVIARTDGLWYIYTEVTVNDAPTAGERDIAYECVLGGTVEHPRDEMYGAVIRSPLSARDPNMTIGGED